MSHQVQAAEIRVDQDNSARRKPHRGLSHRLHVFSSPLLFHLILFQCPDENCPGSPGYIKACQRRKGFVTSSCLVRKLLVWVGIGSRSSGCQVSRTARWVWTSGNSWSCGPWLLLERVWSSNIVMCHLTGSLCHGEGRSRAMRSCSSGVYPRPETSIRVKVLGWGGAE